MRRAWTRQAASVIALGLWVGLAALTPAQVAASPANPVPVVATPTNEYVALGDSYVAGPGIPVQTGLPPGCARSNHNYPSLVREVLRPEVFKDVSCSRATTKDMTNAQVTRVGTNPPQLDALTMDTELVTLGIGGNDIGFGEIISTCASRSPRMPLGAACRDFYNRSGRDELAERIRATAPKVAAVLDEIEQRSSDAKVLVVGYPTILPASGPGCFPVVPFSAGDVEYLRKTNEALNAMLAEQADQAGADYVDTAGPSVGHDVCQLPGTKWVEGLVPTSPAAPVHPNALGMQGSADAVLDSLDVTVLAGR